MIECGYISFKPLVPCPHVTRRAPGGGTLGRYVYKMTGTGKGSLLYRRRPRYRGTDNFYDIPGRSFFVFFYSM